jgi:agmatinase
MATGFERRPYRFAGLQEQQSGFASSAAVVLPVPYEATCTYRPGARDGPRAIIEASRNIETFDEDDRCDHARRGICTLDEVEPVARGPEYMVEAVERESVPVLDAQKLLVTLGGEHTVSLGAIRAAAARHEGLSVLQIDAHLDLRDVYQGTPFSHACVMRRVLDHARVVAVGARSFSAEEHDFIARRGIEPYTMRRIRREPRWIPEVVRELGRAVYVTVDLDGFDPSQVPATGTPEPGGLLWDEATALLRAVAQARRVVAFDIVELSPIPGHVASDVLAAKLAYKLIGWSLDPPPAGPR